MYFFEFVTLEPICGNHHYYYFTSTGARCPQSAELNNQYPDKLRLLVEDREEIPFTLHCIDFFTYIYRKYVNSVYRPLGCRVDWEKEEL